MYLHTASPCMVQSSYSAYLVLDIGKYILIQPAASNTDIMVSIARPFIR